MSAVVVPSYGPRNCLGQGMAWHEIRPVFETLISRFDKEICEEWKF